VRAADNELNCWTCTQKNGVNGGPFVVLAALREFKAWAPGAFVNATPHSIPCYPDTGRSNAPFLSAAMVRTMLKRLVLHAPRMASNLIRQAVIYVFQEFVLECNHPLLRFPPVPRGILSGFHR
jgi:hypothetical protein